MTSIRAVTWNVWWRYGDWQARHAAIRAVLERLDPDIVVLNEVWEEIGGTRQADALAADLGMYAISCCLPHHPDVLSGNAVLSRCPITRDDVRKLSATRSVLLAETDTPAGPVTVFGTHLSWRPDESQRRQEEIDVVLRFAAEQESMALPPLLMGDLNTTPDSDELRRLTGRAARDDGGPVFFDVWEQAGDGGPGHTWRRANPYVADEPWPERRLDYILAALPTHKLPSGWFVPERCWIDGTDSADGVQPSDHYAVVADLRCVSSPAEHATESRGPDHVAD